MVFWRFRIGDDFDFLGCLLGWLGCNVCWYLQIRTIPLLWPQLTGFWSPVWRGWYRPTRLQKINQRQVCMKLFKQNMLQTMKMIQDIFKMHAFSRSHSHTAFATLGEVSFGDVWNRFRSASFLHCSKFPINRLQLFFTLGGDGPNFYGIAPGKTTTIIQKNASKHIIWPISVPNHETENDPEHVSYMRFQQQTLWNDCACNPSSRVTSLRGSYDSNARACVWLWLCGKNQ